MIPYLRKEEKNALKKCVGSELIRVKYHYWNSGFLRTLNWIEMIFSNSWSIFVKSGEIAENIRVNTIEEFNEEKARLKSSDVDVISEDLSKVEPWSQLIGSKLNEVSVLDYRGYCDNSVVFIFEMKKQIEIFGGADSVDFESSTKQIGLLYEGSEPTWTRL